jgi:hypothetical protein
MSDIERLAQAYEAEYGPSALRHALADWHASVDALMRDLAPGYLRLPPLAPVAPPKERPARVLDVDSTQAV